MTPSPHTRLAALLGLIALVAFMSGAGLDAPGVIPAGLVLLIAAFVQPGPRARRFIEPAWRTLAVLLSLRAGYAVFAAGGDPVLPMVDLLLVLLCAESLRKRDRAGDARHFALTFALLIAAAAYRPGPVFALMFIAYVMCATVMLVVGHITRQAELRELPQPRLSRRFLARVALLSSIVLVVSVLVFLFFPRVSRGWASRGEPVAARSMIGFSDRVSLGDHGASIEPNPQVVLRVEFDGDPPPDPGALHWRGRSYNYFDGVAWSRVDRASTPPLESRWPGGAIEQVIYARRLSGANVLFGLHPVVDVTPLSRIRPVRMPAGDFSYVGAVEPVYRVRSRRTPPDSEALRAAGVGSSPAMLAHLQLPALPQRILALADSFRAASANPYDQAVAIERWLRTSFDYTLELPRNAREATLDHFLFERRAGHCEYFSTAMAILLRAGGVPARNVNGFLGGEWNEFGGFLTVTQNHAHSWVEVFFPGYGWVTFDPTPAGGAAGVASAQRRFRGLRSIAEGVSHRWGKWVLDYDIGTQASLLERLSAPFQQEPAASGETRSTPGRRWLVLGILALVGAMIVGMRRFITYSPVPGSASSRAYLSLRRAYASAGVSAEPSLPPLAFAALVRARPGGEAARMAVGLYVRERFGGQPLSDAEVEQLEECVREARRAIRTQREADEPPRP